MWLVRVRKSLDQKEFTWSVHATLLNARLSAREVTRSFPEWEVRIEACGTRRAEKERIASVKERLNGCD